MRSGFSRIVMLGSFVLNGSCAQVLGIEVLHEGQPDAAIVDASLDGASAIPGDAGTKDAEPGPGMDAGMLEFMLVEKVTSPAAQEQDAFGTSIATDGNTIVIGAPSRISTDAGAVYVWRREGNVWKEHAVLQPSDANAEDRFGNSVAVSGGLIAVGAPYNDEKGPSAGSVYVFEYESAMDRWQQIAKLTASDAAESTGAGLGWSVALSGEVIAAGAPGDDFRANNSGAVYVFKRLTGNWLETKVKSSNPGFGDHFGWSLSLSGNRMAVGVPYADRGESDSGAVYVLESVNDIWSERAVLSASPAALYELLGWSVSIRGTTVITGGNAIATGVSGAAYVFEHDGNAWSQAAKLTASDTTMEDFFGYAVATDGASIIVGAYGNDSVAMSAGAAYLFEKRGGVWQESKKFLAADGSASDNLGVAVTVEGGLACAGANLDDDVATNTGSVYVFERRPADGI